MICQKEDNMGRFSVQVELANYHDISCALAGDIPEEQVRRPRGGGR